MKKNILTIVIMASTVLNLVLTIIMVFSIVPAMNKTNKLVDKVASVIDLELEKEEDKNYDVKDLEPFDIPFENKQTINLKQGGDGESHYVILEGISVSFNKEADDYSDVSESVKAASVYVVDCVKEAISEQTIQTLNENTVKELALAKIQEFYDSKCVVRISLLGYMFQ
ncbi:MAG: hypothetical protein HFG32_11140 [Eubacterium sp.]|jgi:flagellar FliL protein|nr:hypothetical protein [Eubacterium sp.]